MGREDRMLKYTDIQKVNAEISGIEVKGKSYAMVNSRIDAFRKICPNGSISTDIIALENGVVTMKATVCDEDGKVLGTGFAQEKETSSYINKTSFIENCETSAVGRALGMCGIGVADSIASAEELVNAISNQSTKRKTTNKAENKPKEKVSAESGNSGWQREKTAISKENLMILQDKVKTDEQIEYVQEKYDVNNLHELTQAQAIELIHTITKKEKERKGAQS